MFLLGLTGGIGSGKSTVAEHFEKLGVAVIDADDVSRQVVEPGTEALQRIHEHFGDAVIDARGALDRKALRSKVFDDDAERRWLEQLLHPRIGREITRQVEAAQSAYAVLVSPLLVESGQSRLVNRVAVVDVPERTQIERTAARDATDEAEIESIMENQAGREERLAHADDVIVNDGHPDELAGVVQRLHESYLKLAGEG